MRTVICLTLLLALCASPAQAQMFQSVADDEATLLQEGDGRLYCPGCGMNLIKFYRTSHALRQPDGTMHQYCSLHCLAAANAEIGQNALVIDVATLQFIPVAQAHYVVGSDVKGTMTMTSKYAFGSVEQAEAFAAEHGGRIMDFAGALAVTRQGLAAENEMVDKKRAAMAEKGAKILAKMCPDAHLPVFGSIAEAKTYLASSEVCGRLNDGQYQALAIYLVRSGAASSGDELGAPLTVPDDTKCPVCGMFVAKYPKWAAAVTTAGDKTYYFDGVKDLMKFYFAPDRYHVDLAGDRIATVTVTDYYSLKAIDGRRAWYVVGANVYGPMGNELIPFASEDDAKVFLEDHGGDRILSFADVTETLVYDLDR